MNEKIKEGAHAEAKANYAKISDPVSLLCVATVNIVLCSVMPMIFCSCLSQDLSPSLSKIDITSLVWSGKLVSNTKHT